MLGNCNPVPNAKQSLQKYCKDDITVSQYMCWKKIQRERTQPRTQKLNFTRIVILRETDRQRDRHTDRGRERERKRERICKEIMLWNLLLLLQVAHHTFQCLWQIHFLVNNGNIILIHNQDLRAIYIYMHTARKRTILKHFYTEGYCVHFTPPKTWKP